jgi:serine protease
MRHRLILVAFLMAALAATAGAATIERGLQEEMNRKGDAALIAVLMVFDQHYDFSRLAINGPTTRRDAVIDALRTHAATLMAPSQTILAGSRGTAENVRVLYIANALAFKADRAMIEALAANRTAATLLHDRSYDLLDLTDAVVPAVVGAPQTKADRADTAWGVKWVKAQRVWSELGYDGTGVLVGHLDSGIWLAHPDLANHIYQNPSEIPGNGLDDDGNGYVDDSRGWDFGDDDNNPNDDNASGGHGTHTAGTVCGDGHGGTITGVAPGARLLPCKVFDNAGSGTVAMIWEGEQYCLEMGARLMTMSLGVKGSDIAVSLLRADRFACNAIREAGVSLFNSAGNERAEFEPPYEVGMTGRSPSPWFAGSAVPYSSMGGVVTVGGTGYLNNTSYSSSSRGPVTWGTVDPFNDWPFNPGTGLIKPDICAPGVNVNSTVRYGGYSGNTWSGTSMSCPHLAGVAALMLQKNPTLSPADIDRLIEQNALDLGTVGKDNVFGSGQVNAYLAVLNTPLTQLADIVPGSVLPDPAGDQVLEPGRTSPVAFSLHNASSLVPASTVQATLAVVANPYVTIVDGSANFPAIPASGTVDNTSDPFQLAIAAAAPQGYPFTMLLTVTWDGGGTRTFDLEHFAGLPEYLTHDVGSVYATVTDQGIIGYMSDTQTVGSGFGANGGTSLLFVGSLWAGNSTTYICNRDFQGAGVGLETYEWVVRRFPNGRMRDLGAAGSDQTFSTAFTDSGHATPANVLVEQTSYAWAGSDDDEFIILVYHLTNRGAGNLNPYWAGVFCDWDVATSSANIGASDAARHAIYLHANPGGPFVGLALLGDSPQANLTFINNPTYVYPNSAIDNGNKLRFLRGLTSVPTTTAPDDWSMVCSAGPLDLPSSGDLTVAFAMVHGATLEDFLANVDAARAAYNPMTPVTEDLPVKMFRLDQNAPNPFNPQTVLTFEVAVPGRVSLAIYDVAGKLVRTLVDDSRPVGRHEATWNGTDDSGQRVSSGVYFAKYRGGDQEQTRKMTMVK